MKSPAYTTQVKLDGKKTHFLGFGCCVVLNMKDEVNWKEAAKEIKLELSPATQRLDAFKRYDIISEINNEDVTFSEYYAQYKPR